MIFSTQKTGDIAMLLYALLTAISSILIHAATQHVTPLLSACNTFLFCLILYSIFASNLLKKIPLIQSNTHIIFILNLTTAICWVFTFISLKYIPPELYLFTYLCALPISAAIIYRNKIRKAILLSLGLLWFLYSYHDLRILPATALAFLGGSSGTIYSAYSKQLTHLFSTIEILALRFYLTVLLTFISCLVLGQWIVLTPIYYSEFAALSFISVMIPLTLFQIGLKNLSLFRALAYMPLAPLACYFINFLLGNIAFNFIQMSAVVFLFATMFL